MKGKTILYILFIAALSMGGCSPKIPFTQHIREHHSLSPEELMGIQFYISHDLVLISGKQSEPSKSTDQGTLIIKKGKAVEEVVFKAGTPCVVTKVITGNLVSVSFEDGENAHLVFGSLDRKNGFYTLQALDWDGGKGKVNYGERMFTTQPGSANTFLVFKMKSINQIRVEGRVVKGKKL